MFDNFESGLDGLFDNFELEAIGQLEALLQRLIEFFTTFLDNFEGFFNDLF